nr:SDR family NAD(P)-dependent oxidoreductase [Bacilli bacterium]
MKLTGNTILITGGSTGIGLALAERFIKAGNTVIICGRRDHALQEAKEQFPHLIVFVKHLLSHSDHGKSEPLSA